MDVFFLLPGVLMTVVDKNNNNNKKITQFQKIRLLNKAVIKLQHW